MKRDVLALQRREREIGSIVFTRTTRVLDQPSCRFRIASSGFRLHVLLDLNSAFLIAIQLHEDDAEVVVNDWPRTVDRECLPKDSFGCLKFFLIFFIRLGLEGQSFFVVSVDQRLLLTSRARHPPD